jgi:hypothetical protein
MAYILMDESGDLGFDSIKAKSSHYFVLTFLFSKDLKPLDKIIKKIFSAFTKSEIKSHSGSLHAYKEKPSTRLKLLNLLIKEDVSILTIFLNKKKVYTKLRDEKHILYNYVTNILIDRIMSKKLIPLHEPIKLIASKRETNKFLNENFSSYIRDQVKGNHKLKIEIEILNHRELKSLQIVDMLSWAIFRSKEHGDDSYKNVIKGKIFEDSGLYT